MRKLTSKSASALPSASAHGSAGVSVQELSDEAWDIGTVACVLQGIELTPTLLAKQKEAIAAARKAIWRIEERNKWRVACAAKPQNADISDRR